MEKASAPGYWSIKKEKKQRVMALARSIAL